MSTQTTILFLASDPSDASRLRLGQEFRDIQEKLQLAKLREKFSLDVRMSVRPGDITQAIFDTEPQIVHFAGHGTQVGGLCFEDDSSKTHIVQTDALASLFELVADQTRCVVLNACYSEAQAKAIAKHIDYVIGMNEAIGDKAAITFAVGFYKALGSGRSIEESYRFGIVELRLFGIPEHLTPVLVKRDVTDFHCGIGSSGPISSLASRVSSIPYQPYFVHPHPMQPNFTGRMNERESLTKWLDTGAESVLVITAIGGMGKSALTWCWLVQDVIGEKNLDGVFWWSFYEANSLFSRFLEEALTYASVQKIHPNELESVYEKARALVNLLQNRKMLMVLDGFERELQAYRGLSAAYQYDFETSNCRIQ